MGAIRVAAIVVAGLVAGGVAAAAIGARVWNRTTAHLVDRLGERAGGLDEAEAIASLPPAVARYFTFALASDRRPIGRAHLQFTGTFAAKPNAWAPFTAEQDVRPWPPGFVWDARVTMPFVSVHVRDSYVDGEGAMRASVAAIVPMVDQRGTPEMAAASLQRFLAEAVWYPTALLSRKGLSWSAINDTSARVTLTDGPTTVSLDVTFGPRGEIETVSTLRYRDVNGAPVLTPWVGHHLDYTRIDGMMIPTSGEVAWVLAEGPTPYWRGRVVAARFNR